MAKATGFYCDNCKTFRTTNDTQAPLGWLRLTVRTTAVDPNGGFDLCSDECVVKFARERVKAAKEEKNTKTEGSDDAPMEDGLIRIPGSVDSWMRDNKMISTVKSKSFWDSYDDGYEQVQGRGYSWVCDLTTPEATVLADFLERSAAVFRNQNRAMTTEERRLASAMDETVERLRS